MGGREVWTKTMLDLLEGSASDGGPTVTIGAACSRTARRRRAAEQPLGRPAVGSSGASRRRGAADPAQLKELLQACLLEGSGAAAASRRASRPRRAGARAAKPRRR